jgi:hypothetical protein
MTESDIAQRDRVVILGLAVFSVVFWVVFQPTNLENAFMIGTPVGRDMANFWLGGRLALEGRFDLLIDIEGYNRLLSTIFGHVWSSDLVFSYPPHMLLVLAPLGALPHAAAVLLWTVTNLVFIVLAVRLFSRGRALVVATLLSPAVLVMVAHGHFGGMLGFLAIWALRNAGRRPALAGLCLALTTVKPQFAVALGGFMLLAGFWRATLFAALSTALLVVASIIVFGITPWVNFVEWTLPFHAQIIADFRTDMLRTTMSLYAAARTIGLPKLAAELIQAAYGVPILVFSLLIFRRDGPTPRAVALSLLSVVTAQPYFQHYDIAIAAPALAVALFGSRKPAEAPFLPSTATVLMWISPIFVLPTGIFGVPIPGPVFAVTVALAVVRALAPDRPAVLVRAAVTDLRTLAASAAAALRERLMPDQRWTFPIVGLAVSLPMLAFIYWPAGGGLDIRAHAVGRDFINLWAGTRLAFAGDIKIPFDLAAYPEAITRLFGQPLPFHAWSYPPNALLLFWLFAQPPYFPALALWTVATFAAFAAVALSPLSREQRATAGILLMLAPASLINAAGGQNGFLTAALFIGGILWLDRRPLLAGVLFGLLTIKPQLGLALPFALVALGAWRTIAAAAITAGLLAGASVALFGFEPWWLYVDVTVPFHVFTLQRWEGFYTIMMASVLAGGRTLGLSYPVALTLQVVIAVPVVAVAAWAVRRNGDPCRRAFVLAAAAPLATPYAFNYDLTALAGMLVWMLCGRLTFHRPARALCLLAWLAPSAMMYANLLGLGLFSLIHLAVFAIAVRQTGVTGPATPHPVVAAAAR